jgi:hypothetical protein
MESEEQMEPEERDGFVSQRRRLHACMHTLNERAWHRRRCMHVNEFMHAPPPPLIQPAPPLAAHVCAAGSLSPAWDNCAARKYS